MVVNSYTGCSGGRLDVVTVLDFGGIYVYSSLVDETIHSGASEKNKTL